MRALRAASDERAGAEFGKAYRDAFGLSESHSAEDRALRAELASANDGAGIGASEAQQRMSEALAVGDKLMARALAQIAFQSRGATLGADTWMAVLEMYGASAPAADQHMRAVLAAGDGGSKIDRFRDKLQTEVSVPTDLQRGSLEAIAADDDGPAAVSGANFGA